MEFGPITLGDLLQTGVLGVIVYLFVTGRVFAKDAVQFMTDSITNGIADKMKEAVKSAIIEAEIEMNGKGKRKSG